MVAGPVKSRFRVAPEACNKVPDPVRLVPTVSVLLFVRVTPVTRIFGIANVPLRI